MYILCREIRECLRLDPDHKVCFPFYKVYTLLVVNELVLMILLLYRK